jgi:hypothetical protein
MHVSRTGVLIVALIIVACIVGAWLGSSLSLRSL